MSIANAIILPRPSKSRQAAAEVHKLKTEWVHGKTDASRKEAESDVFKYIGLFYNRRREHQALDYVSPVAFEERYHNNTMTQAA